MRFFFVKTSQARPAISCSAKGLKNFLKIKMINYYRDLLLLYSFKGRCFSNKKTKIDRREIYLQKSKIKFHRSEFLTETLLC